MIESAITQRMPAFVKALHADGPAAATPATAAGNDGHAGPRSAGPAFVVALSTPMQAQAEHLAAVSDLSAAMTKASVAARAKLDELTGPKSKAWQENWDEYIKLKSEQGLDRMDYKSKYDLKQKLHENEAEYLRIFNTDPVAPVELTGKEKDAAFDLALKKKMPVGAYDTVSFGHGEFIYTFYRDGRVTKNDGSTPRSENHKQLILETINNQIRIGRYDLTQQEERLATRDFRMGELRPLLDPNNNWSF